MNWKYEHGRIFSVDERFELMAEAAFVYKENGEVSIDRTYVNPALRGQGVAGEMMRILAEHLREKGLRASAGCSYAYAWLKKNREAYSDIVSSDIDDN